MHTYYHYSYDSAENMAIAILSICLIALVLTGVFALAGYILHSIGLYTIGKRIGYSIPWLAFIPFARDYMQGELAGEISLKTKKIKSPGVWNLVMPIVSGVIFWIFYMLFFLFSGMGMMMDYRSSGGYVGISTGTIMGMIFFAIIWVIVAVLYSAVYQVLHILINKQIYGRFTTGNMAIAHAVLSSLVPLYEAICTFVLRNKDFMPGMEPPVPPQQQYYYSQQGTPQQEAAAAPQQQCYYSQQGTPQQETAAAPQQQYYYSQQGTPQQETAAAPQQQYYYSQQESSQQEPPQQEPSQQEAAEAPGQQEDSQSQYPQHETGENPSAGYRPDLDNKIQ